MVRARAPGGLEGIFGPASVIWLVDREAGIFLGAGRALLLRLAHPWVARAISEHSRTFAAPIGRFHRTFGAVFSTPAEPRCPGLWRCGYWGCGWRAACAPVTADVY